MLDADPRVTHPSSLVRRFLGDQRGSAAVEYVVMGSMIFVIVVGVSAYFGGLADVYNSFAGYFGSE